MRVYITGLGCITAVGKDVKTSWESIKQGRSGVEIATLFDPSKFKSKYVCEVKEPIESLFDPSDLRYLDRSTQFALIATNEAISDAKLSIDNNNSARTAVIIGNSGGARHTIENVLYEHYVNNKRVAPITIPRAMSNVSASQISIRTGAKGPVFVVNSACASSNHAIGTAYSLIKSGVVDIAITGGTEACLTEPFYQAWDGMRVMDTIACRPFSRDRSGFIMGEGSGILILESSVHAEARSRTPYAELNGFGFSADAKDIVALERDGASQAMKNALSLSGLLPTDIDYINAHGTGTILNDKTETQAIHHVFEQHAYNLSISSTKAIHGHTIGASGAIELIATIMGMKESLIPPTINYSEPDPDCDLDYTVNVAKNRNVKHAMSNSFAFGGTNAALVISNYI